MDNNKYKIIELHFLSKEIFLFTSRNALEYKVRNY